MSSLIFNKQKIMLFLSIYNCCKHSGFRGGGGKHMDVNSTKT